VRRLTRAPSTGLAAVAAVLDRRLRAQGPAPVAVALSGGGDSVALLLAAKAWADARGRRLLALTVDHRLQPQSAEWTRACAARAERLGVGFRALAWEGPKPARGLPAAARAARHALLAEAARAAGVRALLIGHTADDVLEARAMRAAGATTPEPREWGPSPAWPEGRGLFLLRPLLGLRRAEIRAWLAALGEGWIEDPANADLRFARPRARSALAADGGAAVDVGEEPPLALAAALRPVAGGGFALVDRAILRRAPLEEARRLVGLACVCAGGGARLPAAARRDRLAEALRGTDAVRATLAGARVEADAAEARILREAGEAARGGLAPRPSPVGAPVVWDGRFELTARRPGLEARALRGLAGRLPEPQRRALAAVPAAARPALPVVVDAAGAVDCPLLGGDAAEARELAWDRLRAAAGLVTREPE
jgi:tRNA(Ile)-lysidine synthase